MLFPVAKPWLSLSRLLALILLGGFAAMRLLDYLWPRAGEVDWLREAMDCAVLLPVLAPVLWRLRREGQSLAHGRARASTALASIGEGVILADAAGRVASLNATAWALTGWPADEARGRAVGEVFRLVGDDGEPVPGAVEECLRLNRAVEPPGRRLLLRRDGARLGVEDAAAPILGERGAVEGAVLVFRDVTAKRKAEDELKLSASVFSHAAEGIIITDRDGTILRVNRAFCAITGYAEADVLGKNPRILSSGRHDQSFYRAMWDRLGAAGEWQGEVWNRRKNGEIYPEWLRIRAIYGGRGENTHYIAVFSDISERVRDQEYIFRLAYYDSLTALANRALLMDHLDMAINMARRHEIGVAVLFIDMDRFKLVNDSLGHSVGDLLLQSVARALTAGVRAGDTVSRFGGDEFVVCLPEMSGERADAGRDALAVAEKIQRRLSQPFTLQGHEVAVTPSIGVALYPWDGEAPGTLVKHADIAMYHAKTHGRDNVQLFSQAMLSAGNERLRIQSALRKALDNDEFSVHYQAQVDLFSGRIVGAEALLRWDSAELGRVSPAQFIPVAEDTSLILPLGDWVLRRVCRDFKAWHGLFGGVQGLPRVAVNFSPRQFVQPDFVGGILRELEASGVAADCLEVEITEATLMHNTELALDALNRLRGQGIRVAVDDFGVGYSSLSYLKKFPIDVLKIDQSFVRDLGSESSDAQIVRAVIAMGRSLGLTVLAEGVENEAQRAFLRGEGCQEAQGFLFSPPLPADQFAELLRQGAADSPRAAKAA
jgi:diguanylate cyclase (GGDEF)-like protein/PAS domain S-box-containing protein